MKVNMTPYRPRTAQKFWCNSCDSWQVDSENPETGKFFVQFGHSYSAEEQEYSGDYHGVMFAFCTHCLSR